MKHCDWCNHLSYKLYHVIRTFITGKVEEMNVCIVCLNEHDTKISYIDEVKE